MDKRKDPRRKLTAFTPVYSLAPKTLLGYLEDLTMHGARVVGDARLETGRVVTLSIELPKDTASLPSTPFAIRARVARLHTDEGGFENLGFEFVDVTEEQAAVIEAVLQRYEFKRTGD